jgi:hypothetical protein
MARKLRVGFLGLGRVFDLNVRGYLDHPEAEVSVLCDSDGLGAVVSVDPEPNDHDAAKRGSTASSVLWARRLAQVAQEVMGRGKWPMTTPTNTFWVTQIGN